MTDCLFDLNYEKYLPFIMNTKALFAEFIGAFALIFVGVGSIATNYIIRGENIRTRVGQTLYHVTKNFCKISNVCPVSFGVCFLTIDIHQC